MPPPDPVLLGLGRAVRDVRVERELTQEELSLATGVHRNYIGGIERGERSPTVLIVSRLAAGLAISLADLITRAERLA